MILRNIRAFSFISHLGFEKNLLNHVMQSIVLHLCMYIGVVIPPNVILLVWNPLSVNMFSANTKISV